MDVGWVTRSPGRGRSHDGDFGDDDRTGEAEAGGADDRPGEATGDDDPDDPDDPDGSDDG
ncbi:hypothetical protein BRD02_11375 [Halobacteriales archaeon QS_8_69_73]|nr:MAG: hypothetical protein BRD02_11375 [Halobacteriales archaeon QS_8_69_73]